MRVVINPLTGELDLVGDSVGGGGATCATAPELLCRDGRTGTDNDALISTTGMGSFYGTSAASSVPSLTGLALNSQDTDTLGPFHGIHLNANIDTWNGPNFLLAFGVNQFLGGPPFGGTPTPITINDVPGSAAEINGLLLNGAYFIGDDSEGGPKYLTVDASAIFANAFGGGGTAKHLLAANTLNACFKFGPTLHADTAACDAGDIAAYTSFPTFETDNGGTLAISSMGTIDVRYAVGAGVTIAGLAYGSFYEGSVGSGTVQHDAGYICTDATATVVDRHTSLESQGPLRQVRHFGPAIFGSNPSGNAPDTTNGNIFELQHVRTLTGNIGDGQAAGLVLDPAYTGAFTATRHNYIKVENVALAGGAAVTNGCVLWFDAAAGTHTAVDAHAGAGTPTLGVANAPVTGDPDAWVKINVNGTVMRMPAWA